MGAGKRLFTQPGKKDFCCRFSHNGTRGFFDLNTPDRVEAQKRAAVRYKFVVAHGWDAALKNQEFRVQPKAPKEQVLTVGLWIAEVAKIAKGRYRDITFVSYKQALRRLAGEAVLALDHSPKKHAAWTDKVDAVPLSKLTDDVVARWVSLRLSKAKSNNIIEEKLKHTVNHVLRSAKALFSKKKIISKMPQAIRELLPQPLPLHETGLLKEDSSARFTPTVDPESLFLMAHKELGTRRQPLETQEAFELREQQWIAFLLSFCGGLRRRESDLLEWTQVHVNDLEDATLELQTTQHFKAKNAAHAKAIRLDPEVAKLLRIYKLNRSGSKFVLFSEREPEPSGVGRPRCQQTWKALTLWLRGKGIADAKPVHALRKTMGSLMADKYGIHHAQRHLRHTSPTLGKRSASEHRIGEALEI